MSGKDGDDYTSRGYGGASVGFGSRIGIAVVDFQLGFTDARFPLGGAALTDRAVGNTATLLRAARAAGLPVVSCYTACAIDLLSDRRGADFHPQPGRYGHRDGLHNVGVRPG